VFDIGGPEFLIIVVVALLVLGPERLPEMLHKVGRFLGQMRAMSTDVTREFQEAFQAGIREGESSVSSVLSSSPSPSAPARQGTLPDPATVVLLAEDAEQHELLAAAARAAAYRRLSACFEGFVEDASMRSCSRWPYRPSRQRRSSCPREPLRGATAAGLSLSPEQEV